MTVLDRVCFGVGCLLLGQGLASLVCWLLVAFAGYALAVLVTREGGV